MEEVYWRGGFQENLLKERFGDFRWLFSSIVYSLVHVVTLNLVLVAAAFVVGVVLGYTAKRFGLSSAIIAHVVWLLLVIIIAPVS